MSAEGLTAHLAAFVVGTRYTDLSADVVALARRHAIDGSAVMLAGCSEEATRIVHGYVGSLGCRARATVVGTRMRTAMAAAALANGTSAHAHDFDDTQVSSSPDRIYGLMTHPTAAVWPAALAAGEHAGATGAEVLLAYVVGIEVACRLCDAVDPFHYVRGYHSTATIGVFGAAAAAAKLLKLDSRQTRCAIGIAASASAGLRANFGTMTKPLHAGRAAESGVVAAELAGRGLTARADVLEDPSGYFKVVASDLGPRDAALARNPLWGYVEAGSAGFDVERISQRLGRPFAIEAPGLSIKPFPSVVLSHPSMLALLDLIVRHDIAPEAIAKIRVHAGPTVLNVLYRTPTTGTQGKFSLTFCLACIALRRRATLADFTDEFVCSEAVRELIGRIELVADAQIERLGYATIASRIELQLADGTVLARTSAPYRGGRDDALTDAGLERKFHECASTVLEPAKAGRALQRLRELERLDRIDELARDLAP